MRPINKGLVERVVWIAIIAGAIYGAIWGTNVYRNYNEYKQAALKCELDKGLLHGVIENKEAQKSQVENEVEELKQIPLR
jgi:outer membrane lipoprotein SlyB